MLEARLDQLVATFAGMEIVPNPYACDSKTFTEALKEAGVDAGPPFRKILDEDVLPAAEWQTIAFLYLEQHRDRALVIEPEVLLGQPLVSWTVAWRNDHVIFHYDSDHMWEKGEFVTQDGTDLTQIYIKSM